MASRGFALHYLGWSTGSRDWATCWVSVYSGTETIWPSRTVKSLALKLSHHRSGAWRWLRSDGPETVGGRRLYDDGLEARAYLGGRRVPSAREDDEAAVVWVVEHSADGRGRIVQEADHGVRVPQGGDPGQGALTACLAPLSVTTRVSARASVTRLSALRDTRSPL